MGFAGVKYERFEFTTECRYSFHLVSFEIDTESPTETIMYDEDGLYEAADSKDFTDQLRPDICIEKTE